MSGVRIMQSLGAVIVVAFLLVSFSPLLNILNRWGKVPPHPQPAAAIVVLAGGIDAHGELSVSSLRRMIHGIVLFQRGFAPLLAFSGPVNRRSGHIEAEVRAEMARLFGVPPSAILTENTARTTREEAARMAALLQPLGASTILLVTNYEHMARSRVLFEKVGFRVQPASVDDLSDAQQPEARLHWMRQMAQELLARIYYRMAGYL